MIETLQRGFYADPDRTSEPTSEERAAILRACGIAADGENPLGAFVEPTFSRPGFVVDGIPFRYDDQGRLWAAPRAPARPR